MSEDNQSIRALFDVPDDPEPEQPRRSAGVCNRKGIVIDAHVWDEPRLKCTRCGFTRSARA